MKFNHGLVAALTGVSVISVQMPTVAISSSDVSDIAQKITVLIQRNDKQGLGSGVMIKHEGNTYSVLTALHVVSQAVQYTILTPDGQRYALNYSSVKKMGTGIDLAMVQFSSSQTYTVAKIGNSDVARPGTAAYVAGFPEPSSARPTPDYNFLAGQITANGSQPQPDGYTLVYSDNTRPGMSGGPVLNDSGEVIGIHGRAETTISDTQSETVTSVSTGFNLGIPINTFLKISSLNVGVRTPSSTIATAPRADDFFIQGVNKYQQGDAQGAIAAYKQAIALNPNYAAAYNNRGFLRNEQGDKQGALADFNQAISLDPKFAPAYNNRGGLRDDLGDKQGALTDYNQAIILDPKFANPYNNRGALRNAQGDKQGALADYNQAIILDPKFANPYNLRGNLRKEQGDKQGALADYNQAISLDPNYAKAYYNRGVLQNELGDKPSALADLRRAATLAQQQGDKDLAQKIQNFIRDNFTPLSPQPKT